MAQMVETPLSGHMRFATAELDEARERVAQVFCPHRLDIIGRDQLDARHHHLPGERLSLNYIQYGAKTSINPGCLDRFFLVQMPVEGAASIANGAQRYHSTSRAAAVLNPHEPTDMIWDSGCRQVLVQIDRRALEDHLSALLGGTVAEPIRFEGAFDMSQGAGAAFRALVHHLVGEADEGRPSIAPTGLMARQFESALLSGLLEGHLHNYRRFLHPRQPAAAPRYVRRAEDYIDANLDQPIALEDIARVAGVSARGLQIGFRRFRNTTPMAFLRDRRLRQAHRDLCAGDDRTSVTEIAVRWGFTHLGRFSVQYREAFGCMPRETLRNARGNPFLG